MEPVRYRIHNAESRRNVVLRTDVTGELACEVSFRLHLDATGDWRQSAAAASADRQRPFPLPGKRQRHDRQQQQDRRGNAQPAPRRPSRSAAARRADLQGMPHGTSNRPARWATSSGDATLAAPERFACWAVRGRWCCSAARRKSRRGWPRASKSKKARTYSRVVGSRSTSTAGSPTTWKTATTASCRTISSPCGTKASTPCGSRIRPTWRPSTRSARRRPLPARS